MSIHRFNRPRLAMVVGLLACAVFVAYVVTRKSPPPRSAAIGDLGLAVRNAGEALAVSWNPSSLTVRNAISGVLTIQDGTDRRELHLSAGQLRSGTVVYAPQTATVQFRLKVYRDQDRFSAETVTAHANPQRPIPEEVAADGTPPRIDITEPRRSGSGKRPEGNTRRSPARHIRSRPREMETSEAPKPQARAQAAPPARLPELRSAISPAPLIPEPQQLVLSNRPDPLAILARPHPAIAAPPISYLAPIPIRKISPAVPASLRSLIQDSISIEVKVIIDAEGKVIGVTPLNTTSPSQRLLGPRVAQAAMLWRFEPARRNGQPVDSETVLKFDFDRRGRQ
jgi:hypothetical protein